MASPTAELIERREYKYLIEEELVPAIRRAVRPYCQLDPYAADQPRRRYTIDSIYLDSPELALYLANEHEVADRIKLRVRSYPGAPEAPVFFEVKRRCNDVVAKSRGAVPAHRWAELLRSPGPEQLAQLSGRQRPAVERFLALAQRYQAAPVALVRYDREAYVSAIDDYARVTFDFNVRCQRAAALSFAGCGGSWRPLDNAVLQQTEQRRVLLELKFTSAVPRWMVNLVTRLELGRASYSKYGSAVRAWFCRPQLRVARLPGRWSAPGNRPGQVTAPRPAALEGPLARIATAEGRGA